MATNPVLKQVKPGVWINPSAIVSVTCVHAPLENQFSGGSQTLLHGKHYILTLKLCDGSVLLFTGYKEIQEVSGFLAIPQPDKWPEGPPQSANTLWSE